MAPKDKSAVTVTAESEKKKDTNPKKIKKKDDENDDSNLSEEDKELKERLETCVSTVLDEKKRSQCDDSNSLDSVGRDCQ